MMVTKRFFRCCQLDSDGRGHCSSAKRSMPPRESSSCCQGARGAQPIGSVGLICSAAYRTRVASRRVFRGFIESSGDFNAVQRPNPNGKPSRSCWPHFEERQTISDWGDLVPSFLGRECYESAFDGIRCILFYFKSRSAEVQLFDRRREQRDPARVKEPFQTISAGTAEGGQRSRNLCWQMFFSPENFGTRFTADILTLCANTGRECQGGSSLDNVNNTPLQHRKEVFFGHTPIFFHMT